MPRTLLVLKVDSMSGEFFGQEGSPFVAAELGVVLLPVG